MKSRTGGEQFLPHNGGGYVIPQWKGKIISSGLM